MIKYFFKEQVARGAHLFWEKGLTPGNDSGDVSVRDPETNLVYICPRPNDTLVIPNWGVLRPEDVVVMDLDGNIQENNGILATVEAPMHLYIYKARPEIMGIVHSHAEWSSVFAITGKNIPLTLAEQALFLGYDTICAEYGKVGSVKLAENIVKALGKDKQCALLRNHGAVSIGTSLEEAFRNSDFLEKCAKTTVFGMLLGGVEVVSPDNVFDESLL